MTKSFNYKLIGGLLVAIVAGILYTGNARAEWCEPIYGGGQNCYYNKRFDISKKVRIEGNDEWKDKVTDVEEDDVVEFKVKVKNEGEVEVDHMKMKDSLPDEMERVGGDGLTEYWEDFEPGETKTFIIRAKVNSEEYDRENFEKCVVKSDFCLMMCHSTLELILSYILDSNR